MRKFFIQTCTIHEFLCVNMFNKNYYIPTLPMHICIDPYQWQNYGRKFNNLIKIQQTFFSVSTQTAISNLNENFEENVSEKNLKKRGKKLNPK